MSTTTSASPADTFISEPVRTPYSLDAGPGRYRIGLVVLASDYVTERDFINMRPSDEVTIHTSRVRNVNPVTVENLRKMAPLITESASLIIPDGRLDSMAYSCTSGTVVIGYEAVRASIQAARPGIPVATPISASLAAFERLGVRRVAVLTPYVDDVNRAIAATERQKKSDFSYLYGEYLKDRPMREINRPGGSLGRTQCCNCALREWGDTSITDDVIKSWLVRLYVRNGWLDIGRKRPVPHESWFQVAGYFYYFGHYYAALSLKQLPEDQQAPFRPMLARLMLDRQEKNGSWWDYPLYDYHEPYGTAFALMTLQRCLP